MTFKTHTKMPKLKTIKLELTLKELTDLGMAIHDAQWGEVDFARVRNRKIRKMFSNKLIKRHKLWLKIMHLAQKNWK